VRTSGKRFGEIVTTCGTNAFSTKARGTLLHGIPQPARLRSNATRTRAPHHNAFDSAFVLAHGRLRPSRSPCGTEGRRGQPIRHAAFADRRYWARTSAPQLVELGSIRDLQDLRAARGSPRGSVYLM
jgi:hypothetical protein